MSGAVRTFATFIISFIFTAVTARADTFTYSLNLVGGEFAFNVTTPALVSTDTIYTSGITCNEMFYQDCRSLELNPVLGFVEYRIFVRNQLGFVVNIPIPTADFLAPGIYPVPTSSGTFSIVDNPSTVTPEPSSVILLATGMAGLDGVIRRRGRRA